MNGAHDMGGMHGFGPVRPEPNEPWFHAEWEKRAFALTVAMGAAGEWSIDMARQARETQNPADYLRQSYYQIWLSGLERLLRERGFVSEAEMQAGHAVGLAKPIKRVLAAADVDAVLKKGAPTEREPAQPARFKVGDHVRAKIINPPKHTRLPRYVRGHVGQIERVYGCHVLADASAQGRPDAQWLYAVAFEACELWGENADPSVRVSVDAWDSYLEPR